MAPLDLSEAHAGPSWNSSEAAYAMDGLLETCDAAAWAAFAAKNRSPNRTTESLFARLRKGVALSRKPAHSV